MLKTKKSQTLHPGGAKALPGQEDSMVVMLWVLWILFLLDECPATHILRLREGLPRSMRLMDW